MGLLAVPILALTFPSAAASGIAAYNAVVFDPTTHGNVKLPAGTPEYKFCGIADINGVVVQNNTEIGVGDYVLIGLTTGLSDGSAVINPGDFLALSGATSGSLLSQAIGAPTTPGTQANWTTRAFVGQCMNRAQVPATAGSYVDVLMRPFVAVCA